MNRILLIDNHKGRWDNIISQFSELVTYGDRMSDFFDFDRAGNFCTPKFNETDYDFIFIHHSQNQDSIMSSAILDLLKIELGFKLVLFSGGIKFCFENKDVDGFFFRSIAREQMERSLKFFIQTAKNLGRWEIESLFFDYPMRLRKKVSLLVDKMTVSEILATQEMQDLLTVSHISTESKKYLEFKDCDPASFLSKLETL